MKLTMAEVQSMLANVSFLDRTFLVMEKGDGFLIQLSYLEPDATRSGSDPVLQKSRKWYVSPFATETEVIETCWAMVCRSQLHVAGEHFRYEGRQVYSPHLHIQGRIDLCAADMFDAREPPKTP